MILTQSELADLFGVSTRTIQRWTADGMPRRKDGDYDATPCIDWRLEEEGRRLERQLDVDAYDLARTRKMEAEAERVERENAVRAGELVHLDDMQAMVAAPLKQVNASLKNAPARHASQLAKAAGMKVAPAKKLLDDITQEIVDDLRRIRHPEDQES